MALSDLIAPYKPMGRNKTQRVLEAKLLSAGWRRASVQHYSKMVHGKELAIDEHDGHFCVGFYRENQAVGTNEKHAHFDEAYMAALRLEASASSID